MGESDIDQYEFVNLIATVYNQTDYDMELLSYSLEWGKWEEQPGPIVSKESGKVKAQGRSCAVSGTQGEVVWRIRDSRFLHGAPKITFTFDQPYCGENKYSCISNDLSYEGTITIVSGKDKHKTIMNVHIKPRIE